jgi:hypothetical protein
LLRIVHRWINPIIQNPISSWAGYINLFLDWKKYNKLGGSALISNFYPCLADKKTITPFDPQYFHQAVWAMSKIYQTKPKLHIDVGSDVKYVGMLSVICKVEFVDIRPLPVQLENLLCRQGTILNLPYPDASVSSISSMHVIEHIGLGRYGDPIDAEGTRKACAELQRVLSPNGQLYISVPIGKPRVQFNGQRVFSIEEICTFLSELSLVEMALVDNYGKFHVNVIPEYVTYDEENGLDYALGCFLFTKINL